MTGGRFNDDVVANRMFHEMFQFFNDGRAAALATLLFLAVLPVMYINLRNFRRQQSGSMTAPAQPIESQQVARVAPGGRRSCAACRCASRSSRSASLWTLPTLGLLVTSVRDPAIHHDIGLVDGAAPSVRSRTSGRCRTTQTVLSAKAWATRSSTA